MLRRTKWHRFPDICHPQDVRCSTPHLGKGARCALPLHPSGHGSSWVLNPYQRQQTVSPVKHSQGLETSLSTYTEPWIRRLSRPLETHSRETSFSLHPSTWWAFLPPRPLTISWGRLHRDQPCADWMPIRSFATRYPRQTLRRLEPRQSHAALWISHRPASKRMHPPDVPATVGVSHNT